MKIQREIRPLGCLNGTCPGILETDTDAVLVQGDKVTAPAGVEVAAHETLVRIPRPVFDELIWQYQEERRSRRP